jgi:hypothetical protein
MGTLAVDSRQTSFQKPANRQQPRGTGRRMARYTAQTACSSRRKNFHRHVAPPRIAKIRDGPGGGGPYGVGGHISNHSNPHRPATIKPQVPSSGSRTLTNAAVGNATANALGVLDRGRDQTDLSPANQQGFGDGYAVQLNDPNGKLPVARAVLFFFFWRQQPRRSLGAA